MQTDFAQIDGQIVIELDYVPTDGTELALLTCNDACDIDSVDVRITAQSSCEDITADPVSTGTSLSILLNVDSSGCAGSQLFLGICAFLFYL